MNLCIPFFIQVGKIMKLFALHLVQVFKIEEKFIEAFQEIQIFAQSLLFRASFTQCRLFLVRRYCHSGEFRSGSNTLLFFCQLHSYIVAASTLIPTGIPFSTTPYQCLVASHKLELLARKFATKLCPLFIVLHASTRYPRSSLKMRRL